MITPTTNMTTRRVLVAMMLVTLIQAATAKVLKAAPDSWLGMKISNPAKLKNILQKLVKEGLAYQVTKANVHKLTPRWLANFPTAWHQTQSLARDAPNRSRRNLLRRLVEGEDKPKGNAEGLMAVALAGFESPIVAGAGTVITVAGVKTIVGGLTTLLSSVPQTAVIAACFFGGVWIFKNAGIFDYFIDTVDARDLREEKANKVKENAKKWEKKEKLYLSCLKENKGQINTIKEICEINNPYNDVHYVGTTNNPKAES